MPAKSYHGSPNVYKLRWTNSSRESKRSWPNSFVTWKLMTNNNPTKHINPETLYRPRELWKMNIFFWVTSYTSVYRIIMKNTDILKPKVITYDDKRRTYLIKGENVIKLLQKRYVRNP